MAITVQEAQVLFSADGLTQVKSQAGIAGRALDVVTKKAGQARSGISNIRSALSGIPGLLAGLGAGAAAGWMARLAAGAEQTAIAFEVLLGSASASKQMVDALRALDMKTVFGFRELGDAAKMMLNYGVAGESVVPMLSTISDIASGDSMKLEGLTRAFGQIAATGRLLGQDLNQMIQNGFNPLQEISRITGESMGSLKKKMEAGGISAEMVARALESATSAGGRFYGMNDRMSQTTAGQFAKLKSNVELLAIEIGTQLLPVANDLIDWASKFIAKFEGVGTKVKTFVTDAKTWFQGIRDNVADMGVVFGTVVGHIGSVWSDMWANMKSHAQAFFDWITSNAGVMADNVGRQFRNAKRVMTGNTTEEKTLIDEWGNTVKRTVSTLEPNAPLVPFAAPPLKGDKNPTSLWDKIQAELETARRLRQEGRNAENAMPDKPKGKDETFVSDRRRGQFTASAVPAGVIKSQTFSAESLFANLRQGASDKAMGLAKQGLGLQQQQLAAANKMIAVVENKLNLGLA